MRRSIMVLAGLLLALTVGFGIAGTAFAHAKLVSSEPKAGERLSAAPAKVTLVFSEEISSQASDTYFTVSDSKGTVVSKGQLDNSDVDHTTQSATVSSLGDGVYTVAWHTVTPDDGGISSGSFTFGVNADPGPQSNVAGTEQEEATTAATSAPTIAATTAAQPTTVTTAAQPTTVATTQTTATVQPTTTGVTSTLPNTGDQALVPPYVMLLVLLAIVGGAALRFLTWRARR